MKQIFLPISLLVIWLCASCSWAGVPYITTLSGYGTNTTLNGVTNLSLGPSKLVGTDTGKKEVSVNVGYGLLLSGTTLSATGTFTNSSVNIQYVTIQYVTNQNVTIQYVTNQTVVNNYVDNSIVTNEYVTISYVTNQYVTTNYTSYAFITNLFVQNFYGPSNVFFLNSNNIATGSSNYFIGDVRIDGQLFVNSTNPFASFSNVTATGVYYGDGSGLTNLAFILPDSVMTNNDTRLRTFSNTVTFAGSAVIRQGLTLAGAWGAAAGTILARGADEGVYVIPNFTGDAAGNVSVGGILSGDGSGLTNLSSGILATNYLPLVGGTVSGAVLSTSPSNSAPLNSEFATAGWIRRLLINGFVGYNSTNLLPGLVKGAQPYQYLTNLPANLFSRTYTAPNAGDYIGGVGITNLLGISGPVVVSVYLSASGGLGGPSISVHPEIYYSYDDGTNLLGDWECENRTITLGSTNRYDFVISVPSVQFTNPASVYRVFKVGSATGATHPNISLVGGTTNFPSQISYNQPVSQVAVYESITVESNVTVLQTVTAKTLITQNFYGISNYLDKLTITNQIMWVTNSWAGPTNVVNIGGPYDLNYAANTPCEITGFTNKPTYTTAEVLLSVKNTAATNIWVTLPVPVVEDGRPTSIFTITNGTVGMLWLRYTPVWPRTNSVCRDL